MASATYTVTGMTCGHCVNAVKEEVGAIDGVSNVQVELDSGSLTFDSDQEIPREKVAAAVDEAGYTLR
ncbi:heavy-metal-associated domain-containing protein [Gephyromycinifex aptenodytis]|uniref:heavy-metal-associated domain-containing protein n=1 Tax=Gephyromycinifex aptenodytis TaxID=2716227 RepID=UPI001446AF98|nr:copper ion binding protein [Gephyromycinifex aptenodytis]